MIQHNSLNPINVDNIQEIVKHLKDNNYKFYQFYNIEIEADEYSFIQYMLKYKDSPRSKVLNKTYYDIETFVNEDGDFTDPEKVDRPVNSIALYNNISNTAYVIAYVTECNITYNIPDITLDIRILSDEKELIK